MRVQLAGQSSLIIHLNREIVQRQGPRHNRITSSVPAQAFPAYTIQCKRLRCTAHSVLCVYVKVVQCSYELSTLIHDIP